MTRQTVYLIRHGQVNGNILQLDRRLTAAAFNAIVADVAHEPINDEGIRQTRAIAPQIARLNLSCLYSSPLLRARQTAEILAEETGLTIHVRDDLFELVPARLPGPLERDMTLRRAYIRSGQRLVNPFTRDAETFYGAYRRIRRAWIALTHDVHEDFGIVGHQGIFRILFGWILATPRWRVVKMDTTNAGISVVTRWLF
ncbi:MAG: histidine phosphatase family protein [Anaerolineae bacterium]|nr:histidine phosphatase family protein [Anaerolineae bacterium]